MMAAATITIGLLMYVFYQSLAGSFLLFAAIMFLSFALTLFIAIWSGITYRRENGGVISFGHAFLAVFIVFVFNSVAYSLTLNLINHVIDKDYAVRLSTRVREKATEQMEKANMSDEDIKERLKNVTPEAYNPPLALQIKSSALWLLVWAVLSALIALFIKRGSSDLVSATDGQS
jgi:ABC-type multidrug transport system fused ATPase/permease subunit